MLFSSASGSRSAASSRAFADDLGDEDGPAPAQQAPHARVYTLPECLALTDRNHPNIWAARARLGVARGQLDEAKYLPYFQWFASATTGDVPTRRRHPALHAGLPLDG